MRGAPVPPAMTGSSPQTERDTGPVSRSVAAQHQEALSDALTRLSAAAQKAISAVDVADNPAIDIDVPAALAAVADQAAAMQRLLVDLAAATGGSTADGAMTVREMHARLAGYIATGQGNARVFASMRGDHDLEAAMEESQANWTPAEFELTGADVTGRDAPMLVIGHVAFDYPVTTPELTHELAERGHCTKGGTIASGDAYCQCNTWRAADYPDPESRRRSRREHMDLVLKLRRENTANAVNQA